MKIALDECLGSRPFLYGRDLLKSMGTKSHYVNELDVIDFLGFEIKKVKPAEYPEFADKLGDIFDDNTPAVMIRDRNLILLADNLDPHRERTTLIHESGHEIVPWHPKLNLKLVGKDIDPAVLKTIEREAFLAGAEIMFPLKHFVDDSLSLPLSFNSVSRIAGRYNGSFEATSIRYALTNRNIIAIAVIKANDLNGLLTPFDHYSNGERYLFNMSALSRRKATAKPSAPLRVQYCSHSYLFPKFIKSGTEIEQGNIIYECWATKQRKDGEISASVFGSSNKFKYTAECYPANGKVFVLLSLPYRQAEFSREVII